MNKISKRILKSKKYEHLKFKSMNDFNKWILEIKKCINEDKMGKYCPNILEHYRKKNEFDIIISIEKHKKSKSGKKVD